MEALTLSNTPSNISSGQIRKKTKRRRRRRHLKHRNSSNVHNHIPINESIEPLAEQIEVAEAVSIPSVNFNSILQMFDNNYNNNNNIPDGLDTINTNNLSLTDLYNLFITSKSVLIIRNFLDYSSSFLIKTIRVESPIVMVLTKFLIASLIISLVTEIGKYYLINWMFYIHELVQKILSLITFTLSDGFKITILEVSLTFPLILIFKKETLFKFVIDNSFCLIGVLSFRFMSDFCIQVSQLFYEQCSKKLELITEGIIYVSGLVILSSSTLLLIGLIIKLVSLKFINR